MRHQCKDCGVLTSNRDHVCIEYDPKHPCPRCGAPSVYCMAGAPGTGGVWICKANHYYGSTMRILRPDEVV